MIKAIVIIVVVLVAAVLLLAATKPDTLRIQREVTIDAPPEAIFPLIDDFHRWAGWSPWERLDPSLERTYSAAESGVGAVYEWAGNAKVGAGRMEITDTSPPSRVTIQLDFIRPFEGHNVAEFTLEPRGDATHVTWAIHGPNRYASKVFSVFVDMDRLIGRDFETGLASLKALAER